MTGRPPMRGPITTRCGAAIDGASINPMKIAIPASFEYQRIWYCLLLFWGTEGYSIISSPVLLDDVVRHTLWVSSLELAQTAQTAQLAHYRGVRAFVIVKRRNVLAFFLRDTF